MGAGEESRNHSGEGSPTAIKYRRHRHRQVAAALLAAWGAFVFSCRSAETIDPDRLSSIVAAIFIAEGGHATRYPYGIKSIPTKSRSHAKRICENTVRNTHTKWADAGKPGDFIKFLGTKYCPPSEDPVGHDNWVRNVTKLAR